jgi:fibro-slime domain-containing protein
MFRPLLFLSMVCSLGFNTIASNAAAQLPDTLWVPVIFYDFHANGRSDFETCVDPGNSGQKGMVRSTLDADRKPVPTPVACPTNGTSFPCACHLDGWFRPSGSGTIQPPKFVCDSVTNPTMRRWSWTGLVNYRNRPLEWVGPAFDSTYEAANIVMYDSLPFRLVNRTTGVYEYINDTFLMLDNKGYGAEPLTSIPLHNFGFTMEMHTVFKYKKGLTFNFRGDDDVWAFINNKLVMDLGGLHSSLSGFVNLDTVSGLVDGQVYPFDLFYAERCSPFSVIRITSNVITVDPNTIDIQVVPNDTIRAGDTALIIGRLLDKNGQVIPFLSDSIRWTQIQTNFRQGDVITVPRNDSTRFTGTVAYRRIGIVGSFSNASFNIVDTVWIYIIPNDPAQVDIELQNAIAQTRNQVMAQIDSFRVRPRQTITLTMGQNNAFAYAVLRDRYGNYCALADASTWASQIPAVATVSFVTNQAFEGIVGRAAGALNGSTFIVVSQGALVPDTAQVVIVADTLMALRLVNVVYPDVALDSVVLTIDSSITVKVQGIWSTAPDVWVDVSGTWSLAPAFAVTFTVPVPAGEAGQWVIIPSTAGIANLTVRSRTSASVTVPIMVRGLPALDSAITRDVNGNGLIDRVDVTFDCDAIIPPALTGSFSVRSGAVTFPVTAIIQIDARHFWLVVQEQATAHLQTSWTPIITISAIPKVAPGSVLCLDGCAPVIYKVTKYVASASDRARDTVWVQLSEKSYNQTGGTFFITNQPVQTFITWWGASGNALADSLIAGIPNFTRVVADSVLVFSMSNRRNLTFDNWMNIRAASGFLRDRRGNFPDTVNRRVRVDIIPALEINTFPNPSRVTLRRVQGDSILVELVQPNQKSRVKEWVLSDKAGTVISLNGLVVPPVRPDHARDQVKLTLKIYDVAGNSVTWLSTDDLFKTGPDQQAPSEINLYWNGMNKKGMRSAPGVYRAVMYVDYPAESAIRDIRTIRKIGIR